MASGLKLLFYVTLTFLREVAAWGSDWQYAHATFYGGTDASGTMAGACGYGDLYSQGYGTHTAALSTALFQRGLNCGACYEMYCDAQADAKWCLHGSPHVTITATNFCPPNYALPSNNGGWCNPPRVHFDMAYPAFQQIAIPRAGIVPVRYRSVSCNKNGGMHFTMHGNPYFNLVLVTNVGGSGEVHSVSMKGSNTDWIPMQQNWGQNWQCHHNFVGQSISFMVRNANGKVVTSNNVAGQYWRFGQTFEGGNFW